MIARTLTETARRTIVASLVIAALAGGTFGRASAPRPAAVESFQQERGREEAMWLLEQENASPRSVMRALAEKRKEHLNYSLMQDGMKLCRDAAIFGRAHKDERIVQAAVVLADALLHKYATRSGGFVEYDRNTWLKSGEMWRTTPWGTAFCGNRAFEAWLELKDAFTPEQRAFWRRSLENTGAWIYKNPVVAGYVFNDAIDLCGLLWRIGHEFDRPEMCRWALEAAEHRIRRDLDEEGWIQGELGGASGTYQMIGAEYLAKFAWEAKAPVLDEAVRRIFARSSLLYATPTLDWAGNFGTRSSHLWHVPGPLILLAAALGDPAAAYFTRTYGDTAWDGDVKLWEAALAQHPAAPVYPAVAKFRGIDATVVREGPWVAYFANYDRSVWSRGFINLWHAGHQDWIFSTLHSLPPVTLDATARAKARLGDTNDWSGFPHTRVTAEGTSYDSQQRITALETAETAAGVTVRWTEPLLAADGRSGGEMRSAYRFHGEEIEIEIELRDVAGEAQLDFHFMKRPDGWANYWIGEEIEDIIAGRPVKTGGNYGRFTGEIFPAGDFPLCGIQLDRTIFAFEVVAAPPSAVFRLMANTESGLHTGEDEVTGGHGGFRFGLQVPADGKTIPLKFRLRVVKPD